MMKTNPKVDKYLDRAGRWRAEVELLRGIVLECGLAEELKWGVPCYTHENHNIVIIHSFKEYCALLFMKGALLKDSRGILIQQTENVQSARQVRFTSAAEIEDLADALKDYVLEAVEVEKAGLKVERRDTSEFPVPEEFQRTLDERPDVKAAFDALTPGRQRAYLLHFAQPKQGKTREARIEKSIPQILAGKGLND